MSNETWDYIADAAVRYTDSQTEQRWREAVLYWLSRAASDSAVEFSRLCKEGVPAEHARMSVQLSMDHAMGVQAAEQILGVDYAQWLKARGGTSDFASAFV